MRWRRVGVWTAASLAVLAAACAVAFQVLVDPQRLIAFAREKVKATWQRELHIGDASVRLWPVPSIHADKVAFANPPWAKQPHLLKVDRVRADFELLPLLTGRIRIKNLSLEDVTAGLEEDDNGAVSWELHARGQAQAQAPSDADFLHISEIRLRNVRINHRAKNRDAEPLVVREAAIDAQPGLRDVRIEAVLTRHGQALELKARFADLSRLGETGATSEGRVEILAPKTRATVAGTFGLERALAGHAVTAEVKSESLRAPLAFLGFDRGETAALDARFEMRGVEGDILIEGLAAKLGALELKGEGRVRRAKEKPEIELQVQAGRVDWLKTLVDAGGTVKPKRQDEEIFHADPVAWRAIGLVGGMAGTADIRIASLRLGNGLELRNVRTRARLGHGRIELNPLNAEALGGNASGSLRFDAPKKAIHAKLDGTNLMLEQWFRQRGSKVPFSGGPMRLNVSLTLTGDTFRELAASVTGPVAIRMGKGHVHSRRAGEVEELMVRALAPQETGEIKLECVSADLHFRNGRATGKAILGARSDASQLLTSGTVDFRAETLDLRGPLRARSGPSLGLSALAGDVQITGRLARPRIQLDEDKKPAILARAGAAIASAGVTLLGGAVLEAAEKNDPCEAVFK